jgi:hypothetical protein
MWLWLLWKRDVAPHRLLSAAMSCEDAWALHQHGKPNTYDKQMRWHLAFAGLFERDDNRIEGDG